MKNREIKFRVWDNVDFMSTPFTLQDIQSKKVQFTSECPVMQYTGLKDKNGVEIYEGDICNLLPVKGQEDAVNMIGIRAVYHNEEEAAFQFTDFVPMYWSGFKSIEVIGNIYENPDLL